MNSKITIGVTGGIGSGKSIVCKVINAMGYPVFYSDIEAKSILISDLEVVSEMKNIFGEKAYIDKKINTTYLASKIFENDTLRNSINKVIHPKVREAFSDWCDIQKIGLVFNEAAILFETGAYKNFDYTILVNSPEHLRIERVMKRDGIGKEEVIARMKKQWPDDKKIVLADFIVSNDKKDMLIPQIISILNKIKESHENI